VLWMVARAHPHIVIIQQYDIGFKRNKGKNRRY